MVIAIVILSNIAVSVFSLPMLKKVWILVYIKVFYLISINLLTFKKENVLNLLILSYCKHHSDFFRWHTDPEASFVASRQPRTNYFNKSIEPLDFILPSSCQSQFCSSWKLIINYERITKYFTWLKYQLTFIVKPDCDP